MSVNLLAVSSRSCASLEMGQEQMLAEKKAHGWSPEPSTVVGGTSDVSQLLESLLGSNLENCMHTMCPHTMFPVDIPL